MAAPPADPGALDPDSVGRHDFTTTFRGFDQVEVRAYLNKVGSELRSAQARADDLASRLREVEERLTSAEEPDEHRLTAMLGEETARILDAARDAAGEIRTKAEAKTAELVREAQDDATRMTTEASEILRTRTIEAEESAASIRADADQDAERMRSEAAAEAARVTAEANEAAESLRTQSEIETEALTTAAEGEAQRIVERATEEAERLAADAAITAERLTAGATAVKESADAEAAEQVESAVNQGREMVAEAQVVRERILTDLARRRKAARAQLEQLRAARDRLIEAYAVVRRTLDEATTELNVAVPEARVAAEAAGRRVEDDDDMSVEEIEAELDAGRFAGLPLLDTSDVSGVDVVEIDVVEIDDGEVDIVEVDVVEIDVVEVDGDPDSEEAVVTDLFARLRAEVPEPDETSDAGTTSDDTAETTSDDTAETASDDTTLDDAADTDEDRPETILERRDRRLVPVEKSAARLLKRHLADDENDKLDLIRRMAAKDKPDSVLGTLDEHRAPWLEPLKKTARNAAAAGRDFAVEVMAETDLEPADESDVPLDDLVDEIVDSMLLPIREKVTELLEGSHDDEALDGVRSSYRQWKGRAGDLSAQLVHSAFNLGVFATVPDGAPVTWVLDDGDGPCPDGADDALAGAVAKGEEFPTGHLHPPAHAGCRCLLVPGAL